MQSVVRKISGASRLIVVVVLAFIMLTAWLVYASQQDQKISVPEAAESTSNQAPYLKTQAELEAEAAAERSY